MSEIISTDTAQATIHIKIKGEGWVPVARTEDKVSERNLVGTSRTMVNRLGFGSKELNLDIWCYDDDYNALNGMRGEVVAYGNKSWDLTFGDVMRLATSENVIYDLKIRLKEIAES